MFLLQRANENRNGQTPRTSPPTRTQCSMQRPPADRTSTGASPYGWARSCVWRGQIDVGPLQHLSQPFRTRPQRGDGLPGVVQQIQRELARCLQPHD